MLPAQTGVGSISGVVSDPSGSVMTDVEVQVQCPEIGFARTTRSDAGGRFSFSQLPPGHYILFASSTGFADLHYEPFDVQVNTPVTLAINFREFEAVTETVTISAAAAQVNTTDASVGNAFGTKPITQLPLNARNPAGLLSLQPGVTFLSADPLDSRSKDIRNGSVNGAQSNQSNITLDGVDVNDQANGLPFLSVLRNTLDSIQEFRVVTTTSNADMGRSSGAQVALITKSGTNEYSGSFYEFHRNTKTAANDFFNNRSDVPRPKLIRNVFGGSLGGPLVRNRAFFFVNHEVRRDASDKNTLRDVPSVSLRQGTVKYLDTDGEVAQLDAEAVKRLDPLGLGPNPASLDYFNSFPEPNDNSTGDGLNTAGYRFTAPTPLGWRTSIAKLDWNIDSSGSHRVFLRGNLQADRVVGAPQFPGDPPNTVNLDNSRGIAFGWTSVLGPRMVGNLRYGLTRQGLDRSGVQTRSLAQLAVSSNRHGSGRSRIVTLPVHTLTQDLAVTRGPHNLQLGGAFRSVRSRRVNFEQSFHSARIAYWSMENIAKDIWGEIPNLSRSYIASAANAMMSVLGTLNYSTVSYQYDLDGNPQPVGDPVRRTFGSEELELYFQDTWRIRPGLTFTGGIRWTLAPAVREVNGVQVSIVPSIDEYIARRVDLSERGVPSREAGSFTFVRRDDHRGGPLYATHKLNFAPRLALAFSPQHRDGWLAKLFGGPNGTSIRVGAGLFYDRFGMGIMEALDRRAYGLSTTLTAPLFTFNGSTAPRFTGPFDLPHEVIPPAPPGGPGTPPDAWSSGFAIDDKLRPPRSMSLTLMVARDLGRGFVVEGGYIGRLSRRLLLLDNAAAQQVDFRDPQSGERLFDSLKPLEVQARADTLVEAVQPIAFWENLYAGAASEERTATQMVYEVVRNFSPDTGAALSDLDVACQPVCSDLGAHTFFMPQYWRFHAIRSIGKASYHSMQWTLRKRFTSGYQFDLNYSLSRSLDLASQGEQPLTDAGSSGYYSAWIIGNSWKREQQRAVSDFDMRHQVNANWVVELPIGREKPILGRLRPPANAVLGGWQVSGVWRFTSGLPLSVRNGAAWPTNWCCVPYAEVVGPIPDQTNTKAGMLVGGGSGPNVFDNPAAALKAFEHTYPGSIGVRNNLRGHGIFSVDLAVGKRFQLPFEGHSLQFRAEAFNVTNTVRFNADYWTALLTEASTFGQYTSAIVPSRVMQFGLRYEF